MNNTKISDLLNRSERDVLFLHLLFTILCALVLIAPIDVKPGIRMLFLVIIYNIAIPLYGGWRKYDDWVNLWLFAFILSIFQVFPDWFLSAQLNILVFPEDGLTKIGTVSGYMAGLWTIPIFLIIYSGQRIKARYSKTAAYMAVALVSLAIFGVSEQTLWILSSWYAKNVVMIGHIAIYIIIPEIILGLAAFFCFDKIKEQSHWVKIPCAFLVMQLYLGSAAFFYFLVEKILF
ncbi:MAG: hypothetical protein JRI91_06980 [Deltaproteobacteria bacterium]|nr:hypothetical protein [Deltaproteobacteria bacterium]